MVLNKVFHVMQMIVEMVVIVPVVEKIIHLYVSTTKVIFFLLQGLVPSIIIVV